MKNANKPAAPTFMHDVKMGLALHKTDDTGLTKREECAMRAMQGILSNSGGVIQANSISGTGWCNFDAQGLAEWSLECADALLAELEK